MAQKLTGKQKAVIVLLNIDRKSAAEVMKSFSHTELLEIGMAMTEMEKLYMDREVIEEVLKDFVKCSQKSGVVTKASGQLFLLLKDALGEAKAQEIMELLKNENTVQPFENLSKIKPGVLSAIIQGEHPQTIALVLSHVEGDKAAEILQGFDDEKQQEVIERLLTLEEASIEIMEQISEMITARASILSNSRLTVKKDREDRVKSIADILNAIGEQGAKVVLQRLAANFPEMAEDIQERMFVFEDLLLLSSRYIRMILAEVETKTIALALKGIKNELSEHILSSLSNRVRQIVNDEKDILGMVPIEEVYQAQREIIKIAQRLNEEGKIHLRKSKGASMQMVE